MSERTVVLQRLCLATVLAAGFAVVFGLAVIWLNEVRSSLVGMESQRHEQLIVTAEEEPLIATQWHDGTTWSYEYRTLDGEPAPEGVDERKVQRASVLAVDDWEWNSIHPAREAKLIGSLNDEHWYQVVDRRGEGVRVYFAGYDGRTGRSVGYLAREGFQRTRPTAAEMLPMSRRMEGHLATIFKLGPGNVSQTLPRYLLSDGELLEFGSDMRSLAPALPRSDFVDMAVLYDPAGPYTAEGEGEGDHYGYDVQLRTRQSVVMFDPAERTAVEYPLPEELRRSLLQFYPVGQDMAALAVWEPESPWTAPRRTYVIDGAGTVVQRGLSLMGTGVMAFPDDQTLIAAACAFPMPLTWVALWAHATEVGAAPGILWGAVIITLIAGAAAAWVIAQDAARRRLSRPWLWAAFGFVFGLPGYIGYRLHRARPQPIPAAPAPRGTEVFA
jgi:hypothetical protein